MRSALLAACALLLPPPALTWREGPALPAPRDHHATFIAGRYLYVAGGNTYANLLSDVWRAALLDDGSLGDWSPTMPLPAPRGGHSVVVTARSVVLTGGQFTDRANTPTTLVAPLDSSGHVGAWRAGPPLPGARFHHASVLHQDWIYVTGGLEARTSVAGVAAARIGPDGMPSAWIELTPLPAPRSHHASFVHDGALFVVAGLNGNPAGPHEQLRDIVRAAIKPDGTLEDWTTVGRLDSAYATHAAFVHDGWLYVVGGVENNSRFVNTVQRAPIREGGRVGFFEQTAALPVGRGHVHQTPVRGNFVYSVGGSASRRLVKPVYIGTLTKRDQ
jgi:hypothetical protein